MPATGGTRDWRSRSCPTDRRAFACRHEPTTAVPRGRSVDTACRRVKGQLDVCSPHHVDAGQLVPEVVDELGIEASVTDASGRTSLSHRVMLTTTFWDPLWGASVRQAPSTMTRGDRSEYSVHSICVASPSLAGPASSAAMRRPRAACLSSLSGGVQSSAIPGAVRGAIRLDQSVHCADHGRRSTSWRRRRRTAGCAALRARMTMASGHGMQSMRAVARVRAARRAPRHRVAPSCWARATTSPRWSPRTREPASPAHPRPRRRRAGGRATWSRTCRIEQPAMIDDASESS